MWHCASLAGVARETEVDVQVFEVGVWEGIGGIYWEDLGPV